MMTDVQAFWRVRRAFLFASGSYLVNPQDTDDPPSILTILGLNTTTGSNAGLGVNSIPDQYVARLCGSVQVWKGSSSTTSGWDEGVRPRRPAELRWRGNLRRARLVCVDHRHV